MRNRTVVMGMAAKPGTRGAYPKGVERRRQIVRAAARIFAQYGYHAGSLRNIADEVGVTSAALIRHFQSKEGLLTAVLEYWNEESQSAGNPATGLAHIRQLPTLMAYHLTHRGLIELFLTLAAEASNPEHPARDFIVKRYEITVASLSARIREAIDAGEVSMPPEQIESEARGLVALMDGIELQWLLHPELDLVGLFTTHLEHLLARWTGQVQPSIAGTGAVAVQGTA
ncbi:TetR/AcrR family transcriptional regulator [Arthrobacter sp. CDRTa11]|uniref:TetR/AcrR family transcriptional regulator n=1 Tax=Arthrobacter sp. CDRTa11 TaxID=2651199 RepID=UPI0022658821|nr:TetR/AcrR family transcriptional regulator [Arthrobacter sp. CDRTa11]UZX03118.1 TetR/AcrR family transcriptional regulator [Arthrobacter sp. CDRTa11]